MFKSLSAYIHSHDQLELTKSLIFKEFSNQYTQTRASQVLGMTKINESLLFESMVHRSFLHEFRLNVNQNERLEFLGDSVLQLYVTQRLLKEYPESEEGVLSKLRSSIVNTNCLGEIALYFGLQKVQLVGKGEFQNGGNERANLLGNSFEAFIGAIFESVGFEETLGCLTLLLNDYSRNERDLFQIGNLSKFDPKSKLQEVLAKKFKTAPTYSASEIETGIFEVHLTTPIKKYSTTNPSKKKAMVELASLALTDLSMEEKTL